MKTMNEEMWQGEMLIRAVHIRLSPSMYRKLVRYCKRKGMPASILVRNLLRDFLDPGSIEL